MWRASKVLSALLSVAGAATAAYGAYEMTCGRECRPATVHTGLSATTILIIGISAVLVGAGAGALFLFGGASAVGAGLLTGISQLPPADRGMPMLGGGIVLAIGLAAFIVASKQGALARRLFNTGLPAIGTVVATRSRTIVAVWIQPRDGSPGFSAEKPMSSHLVKKVRAGKQVAVLIDPGDRSRFDIILPGQRDLPRQWRDLVTYVDALPDAEPPTATTPLPEQPPQSWVLATIVGLLATVAIGYSVYDTFMAAGCPTDGSLCRPHTPMTVVIFAVAVAVATIARALDGKFVAFAMFLAVGVGAMVVDEKLSAWQSPGWGLTLVIVTIALTGLGMIIWVTAQRDERLRERGVVAIGTVQEVTEIPRYGNQYELTLEIAPQDGSPEFAVSRQVSLPERPFAGQQMPVLVDPRKRSRLVVFTGKLGETPPARLSTLAADLAEANEGHRLAAQIPAQGDPLDRLERLNALRLNGGLTDEEYQAQKAKILGTAADGSPQD